MKRTFLLTAAILAALSAAAQWQPAGDRIKTVWGENLDPQGDIQVRDADTAPVGFYQPLRRDFKLAVGRIA